MKFSTKFSLSVLFAVILLCSACGPTYVVQPNGQQAQYQQYDPGYDPNQFLYDAMLADAIYNGQRGYWGPGHVFYPMVTIGGVVGYYDGNHHFHTSVQNKTVVINNYNHGRDEFVKTHPLNAKPDYSRQQSQGQSQQTQQKPNYTSQQNGGQGTIGRGPSTQQQASQAQQKPQYGSGGTIGRGAPSAAPAPAASSKPNYGSGGSIGRSAPSAPSKPSFSSSPGSASRRK